MLPLTRKLIDRLRGHFKLDWRGIHGAPHWARVRANGMYLSRLTGADPEVVTLFAFLHDACRNDDDRDPWHGYRAVSFITGLSSHEMPLTAGKRENLLTACALHSEGHTSGYNMTVLTCWDADRLDLGRVGVRPDTRYLCTDAARDERVIERAWKSSRGLDAHTRQLNA